jgi:hypothetical protein
VTVRPDGTVSFEATDAAGEIFDRCERAAGVVY